MAPKFPNYENYKSRDPSSVENRHKKPEVNSTKHTIKLLISSVQFSTHSCLTSCDPKDCTAHQASLSKTNSQSLFKLMSTDSVMPSRRLILCRSLVLPPSIFPSIRVFSNESVLHIRWPEYWSFSFSISPFMNIQVWFPLGLTGLISFLSKGLSRVFSSQHSSKPSNSSVLSLLYGLILTSVHDYWKNHSFDYIDLSRQSDIFAF